jgi:hypothetical protein
MIKDAITGAKYVVPVLGAVGAVGYFFGGQVLIATTVGILSAMLLFSFCASIGQAIRYNEK